MIEYLDLNDIQNEPSDDQLQALMKDVTKEVRRKNIEAMERQDEALQQQIFEAQNKWFPPPSPT